MRVVVIKDDCRYSTHCTHYILVFRQCPVIIDYKCYMTDCGIVLHVFCAAYTVGLVCTYIALTFMKTAQPALLYLVPTTLLSVVILSLIRREFRHFFTGKPQVRAYTCTTHHV